MDLEEETLAAQPLVISHHQAFDNGPQHQAQQPQPHNANDDEVEEEDL